MSGALKRQNHGHARARLLTASQNCIVIVGLRMLTRYREMATVHTKDNLIDIIEKKTREIWEDRKAPWLLSDVEPFLRKEGFSYKDLIAPLTLKKFAAGLDGKVKVIQHSSRRARVGLIPPDKSYSFDTEVADPTSVAPVRETSSARSHSRNTKYVVLNFLQALSTLDEEDLEKVVIPTSVLAKLVKEK